VSRRHAAALRGRRNAAPATLGRDLAARYLVNGTIQRDGERIVVRVELTRADRGVGVWSERYDRTSASVLDVIDGVARGVATGVAGQLLPAEAADLARRPTADAAAYEHFLRGNFYLAQRNAVSLARAAEEYEQANALDPGFAASLARVAYVHAARVEGRRHGRGEGRGAENAPAGSADLGGPEARPQRSVAVEGSGRPERPESVPSGHSASEDPHAH
jgi:adenylate cyclase